MKKIAIFRALYLGDFLCSVPALRALRKYYPDAEITLIGLSQMSDLADRYFQYIDHFVPFPGFPLLSDAPFDPDTFQEFLEKIRSEEFDLILQMQGNGSIVNNLLKSFNAKIIAGFCETDEEVNDKFILYPSDLHEIQRHLALLTHLGISSDGEKIDFPINEKDREDFNSAGISLNSNYICIHPGSKAKWRQWPVEYFAKLGNYFAAKGFHIVITGVNDEIGLAKELSKVLKADATIATGKLSLGATAVLLSKAKFLLTNCTGISHLAAAIEVPSLVISMDGEPHRWGPLNRKLHNTIDWKRNPDYNTVFNEVESISFIESPTSSAEG